MKAKVESNILHHLKKKSVKRFSLFFIIAFIFLIFSKLSNDYKQTVKLKVNLINVDDEIILQNDSLSIINAYIQAKGFVLFPFVFKDSKDIFIDVNTYLVTHPNYFVFDVQKHKFLIEDQLGESYKVLSLKPDTLELSYSKMASKYLPVKLNTDIKYAVGFDLKDQFVLDTDSVKVVGSSNKVNAIDTLITETLELNAINTNIEEVVQVDVSNLDEIEIFPKSIIVKGEVTRFTEGSINVPVTIINKPPNTNINYFPKTVEVLYYVDLDRFNSIKASDFTVECNYENLEKNQTFLVPYITKMPEFVKRVGLKPKRIDFIRL